MRRARWIAVWCLAWALTGPFTSSRAGPLAEPNSEKTDPLVQPTNDLVWLERTKSVDAKVLLATIRFERGDSAAALTCAH